MFEIESMIRGYHVYKEIWDAVVGEELECERDTTNHHDRFAVAILKDEVTVGHAPRKILSVFSLFLRHGGSIRCRVTASRRYSADLPQGGLEIPCIYKLEGDKLYLARAQKLITTALTSIPDPSTIDKSAVSEPLSKTRKVNVIVNDDDTDCDLVKSILRGEKLSDLHINLAQSILKRQFPPLRGLCSTLIQKRKHNNVDLKNQLQIIHSHGDHWIAASNVGCEDEITHVYDSVYSSLDRETEDVVHNLFQAAKSLPIKIEMRSCQKQAGGTDCGLFSIAFITAIAYNEDPSKIKFCQMEMRSHLANCFKNNYLTLFPTII